MKQTRNQKKRSTQSAQKRTVDTRKQDYSAEAYLGEEIAYQNKDITSKVLAENFKGKTFRVYGLDLPEIQAVLPTNIPTVKVNELRLDDLFELVDGTVALVDYESDYQEGDKIKYLNYLTGIANRYQREKKHCPTLRMIVIYTGDIERRQITEEYDIGAVRVTVEPAFLSELDSGTVFQNLKEKVEKGELLSDEELMQFIILPLSYKKKEEKEEMIHKTVNLAARIRDRNQQLFTMAGILAFTDKVIDMKAAEKIRRVIEMTKVGQIIEEEKRQAQEELRQELAETEEEKRQALKQLKKEKKKAAKAKAEKQQAARESVVKMLQKNYPTEEIVSIISGFSQDDIEAMRKEIIMTR